jgi:hypothetical protein
MIAILPLVLYVALLHHYIWRIHRRCHAHEEVTLRLAQLITVTAEQKQPAIKPEDYN